MRRIINNYYDLSNKLVYENKNIQVDRPVRRNKFEHILNKVGLILGSHYNLVITNNYIEETLDGDIYKFDYMVDFFLNKSEKLQRQQFYL